MLNEQQLFGGANTESIALGGPRTNLRLIMEQERRRRAKYCSMFWQVVAAAPPRGLTRVSQAPATLVFTLLHPLAFLIDTPRVTLAKLTLMMLV